jgi:RNA polymerase sigma-70 factor (ECF subfamily)
MDRRRPGHEEGVGGSPGVAEESFAEVYRRYHPRVWRALSCLGVPDAALEDAVQDVFVVVHRRMGEPEQYTSVRSWLYAVARRVAWRHHRTGARARRKLEAVGREPTFAALDPEQHVADREAVELMRAFLDELDLDQRTVFVLAEIEGLPAPQIAEIVEAKLATVYSRLRLARARFARVVARANARARREAGDVESA